MALGSRYGHEDILLQRHGQLTPGAAHLHRPHLQAVSVEEAERQADQEAEGTGVIDQQHQRGNEVLVLVDGQAADQIICGRFFRPILEHPPRVTFGDTDAECHLLFQCQ